MASTNKTDNLNLSQFIDTDKPSWLTDYNNDMDSIDEGVGALRARADAADTAVAALQETTETLTSDVNAVRTAVGAVETAQEELGQQVSAQQGNMNDLEVRMDSALANKANTGSVPVKYFPLWEGTASANNVISVPNITNFDILYIKGTMRGCIYKTPNSNEYSGLLIGGIPTIYYFLVTLNVSDDSATITNCIYMEQPLGGVTKGAWLGTINGIYGVEVNV